MDNPIFVGRIKEILPLAGEVFRVWIDFDGPPPHKHRAGQYLLLKVSEDNWSAFSIANAVAGKYSIELHIRPPEGKKGEDLRRLIQVNRLIQIQIPFGESVLPVGSDPILLLVGGTGFSQAKAIIEGYLEQSTQTDRIALLWLAADQAGLYMQDWLAGMSEKHAQLVARSLVLDHAQIGIKAYIDSVLTEIQKMPIDVQVSWAFLAGAPPMVKGLIEPLVKLGIQKNKIRSDVIDLNL